MGRCGVRHRGPWFGARLGLVLGLFPRLGAAEECPSIPEVLARVHVAIGDGDLAAASTALEEVTRAQSCAPPSPPDELAAIFIANGSVQLALGRAERASAWFEASRRVSPAHWVGGYPVEAYAAWMSSDVVDNRPATAMIQLNPPVYFHTVWLDGRPTSVPARVEPGIHAVQLVHPRTGRAEFGTVVFVSDGESLSIERPMPQGEGGIVGGAPPDVPQSATYTSGGVTFSNPFEHVRCEFGLGLTTETMVGLEAGSGTMVGVGSMAQARASAPLRGAATMHVGLMASHSESPWTRTEADVDELSQSARLTWLGLGMGMGLQRRDASGIRLGGLAARGWADAPPDVLKGTQFVNEHFGGDADEDRVLLEAEYLTFGAYGELHGSPRDWGGLAFAPHVGLAVVAPGRHVLTTGTLGVFVSRRRAHGDGEAPSAP